MVTRANQIFEKNTFVNRLCNCFKWQKDIAKKNVVRACETIVKTSLCYLSNKYHWATVVSRKVGGQIRILKP